MEKSFIENMRETRREALDLSIDIPENPALDERLGMYVDFLDGATDRAKKIFRELKSGFDVLLTCKNFERLFWKAYCQVFELRSRDDRRRDAVQARLEAARFWAAEFVAMVDAVKAIDTSSFDDDIDRNLFISCLEAAHLSIIDIMLAVDGLDRKSVDAISGYDFFSSDRLPAWKLYAALSS